ncbi:amino acid adenylation domain-containing protein [Paenibacillus sp. SAF-068]|uniref:amino acid adenylation domain-containing protein n=1 Tax=Paenibacillus sp. SAF-068 TaxID=3436864 RepID=UPI003F809CEF
MISICKEVLKNDDISIQDDLFELGASSIELMQLISKIHIEFGIRLEVSDLFRTASLEHLADYLQSRPQSEYQSVKKVNTNNSLYSSSASQKRMFAANQLDTGLTYNVTTAFMIEGAIDLEKLNMAFNMLVDRHETLRSSFAIIDGQIRQYVHSDTQITIRYAEVPYQNIDQIISAFIHPFNLAESPLLRVTLVNYEPERYVLIMDAHHIIMDGASVDIMLNEVFSYYNGEQLSEITVHQKDFIEHMNQIPLEGSEAEKFWMTMFEGEIPLINLSTDYPRPVYQKFEGRKIRFTLTGQMLHQLKETASRSGTTLYMILLSTYYVLLNKYTNQEDIVIGTLFSGRTHPDIEKCIGMFINTVPLRNYPVATKPFIRFMNEVEECVLQAMRHQHYPFENVMENLSLDRNMSRNPMFDTVFIMHEEPFKEVVGDDFQGHKTEFHNKTSRVDLTLEAMILNGELILEFEYSTNLFREETIQRMANHFQNTLKAVLREPEIPLCEIDVLSQTDKYALLKQPDHNEACSDPPVVGFMELFKQAVSLNPDYTAVVFKENEISYADLDLKSSQLAVTLQRNGVDSGTRVGIMVESGFEAIVSMLAVIKAKGTFLLVDPHYPMERKRYMMDDSNVSLLLSRETEFAGYKVHNISDASLYDNDGVVSESISPNDPAYIMYTSGSSGRPKGVLINHKSLNYFIRDFPINTAFDTNASIVSMTSVSFDPFIVETLLPLAKGMRVVVAEPDAHRNLRQLSDLMLVNEVDILQTTPSRLKVLMGNHSDYFQRLKLILIGGEHFDNGLLNKLKEITNARIFNIYGPTETTVWSATKELTESGRITIGKPLEHMSYYILNNYLNLVPIGVEGELCISGSGLSEGYLNNAELSEAKFVLNPFRPNELMYRSGDYAKILDNGEIELIGRHDDQVKIRGHRIELREIENNISNHDLVNEAVVLTPELPSGEKTVCVYYVAKNELDLRTFLSDILPAYMMPNYFIRLESLPLTVNGKLDRKRLPLPTVESISESSSVLVANEKEEVILSIWKEILEINHCDLGHSFFELGGHSLNGLLVITRLNRIFNVDLELRDLFENRTVSKLSALIDAKKGGRIEAFPPIEQCLPSGHYRLSFAQARMYTVHQLADIPTAYNVPHMYKISDDVEYSRLQEAFAQVIQQHSVFRTSFEVSSEGIPVQRIHEHVPFKLEYKKLHNQTLDEAMNEFVRPFDLEKAPLLRAQLVETDNRESVLLLDVHHIIIDAASMMIMLKDLIEGYKGNKLSEPSVDYKDYCLWEERILHMPRMKRQEEYWLTKYEPSRLLGLELPTDFTRPTIQSFAGDCITFELDKSLTNRLKSIALATDSTLFMVLLSAYKSLLFIYSNQTDIVVGTPVSGRWQAELNDVIGMFANTVVIQSHIDAGQPFANLVQTVRSNTMQAFSNQEYPFDRLVDKLKTGRGAGRNPLFDVMFVLQTVNFSKHELEGMPIEYMHYNPLVSKFDLLIQAYEDKGSIHFMLDYSTKLFKRETIQKMVDYFNVILESVAQDMNIILSDIEVVSEEERQRLLNFNEAGNYDF